MLIALVADTSARAAAQSTGTAGEFWPALAFRYQWPSALSVTAFAKVENADDIPFRQLDFGARLAYQAKRMVRPHLANIDPEAEHSYVASAGYEYLQTFDSGVDKYEDRLSAAIAFRQRPTSRVLLGDRNRFEFRRVDGVYSTRYRNKLTVLSDVLLSNLRLSPYAAAEVFYSWDKEEWNEVQYTVGVQWPHKHAWMVDTYYLRQNCGTCNPSHLNVAGLGVTIFFGVQRQRARTDR